MPDYKGFAALGSLLGGGGRTSSDQAYYQGQKLVGNAEYALEQASHERAKRLAQEAINASRGSLTGDLVTRAISGDQSALGELGAATMGMASGQPNLGTFTDGLKDLGDLELDRQIGDALEHGDTATARRLSAVKTDKVLPSLGGGGNVVFDATTGGTQLTPLGDAEVAARTALEAQRRAGAAAQSAHAALYARTDPNKKGTGSAAKPPNYTAPASANLAAVLGDKDGAVSAETARDFQVWRAAHPELRNGEEALNAYVSELGGQGPIIIDPTQPGSMTRSPPTARDRVYQPTAADETAVMAQELGRPLSQQELGAMANGTLDLRAPVAPRVAPPLQAIQFLRKNPGLAADFEAKYGVPAAQYLGR